MKVLLLALVFMLVVTSGSALECHHCTPRKAGEACEITAVRCEPEKDACAAAKFNRAPYGHFQKCMRMSDCEDLKMNAYIQVKCCQTDLCNTF
ncbi:CD59B glycoprotein [Chanos chanos]|uniref:CD59B glycoprotein-like n=1 Tax=Chanos chanos TaxID=29144 RepID=A0A6J2VA90_CHACN|nr:CD59B glycoprotein-like [Chanos chanos]XP_030629194.1 CD59B glycoprotein-like [Chanos chanos]